MIPVSVDPAPSGTQRIEESYFRVIELYPIVRSGATIVAVVGQAVYAH